MILDKFADNLNKCIYNPRHFFWWFEKCIYDHKRFLNFLLNELSRLFALLFVHGLMKAVRFMDILVFSVCFGISFHLPKMFCSFVWLRVCLFHAITFSFVYTLVLVPSFRFTVFQSWASFTIDHLKNGANRMRAKNAKAAMLRRKPLCLLCSISSRNRECVLHVPTHGASNEKLCQLRGPSRQALQNGHMKPFEFHCQTPNAST